VGLTHEILQGPDQKSQGQMDWTGSEGARSEGVVRASGKRSRSSDVNWHE
jgi:hypothetical protein